MGQSGPLARTASGGFTVTTLAILDGNATSGIPGYHREQEHLRSNADDERRRSGPTQ